jgi:hypothetical protein
MAILCWKMQLNGDSKKIVALLLSDPRVDSTAFECRGLKLARRVHKDNVVALFLKDSRVVAYMSAHKELNFN